jgi:hypothetical protein
MYAVRHHRGKMIYMHRVIMKAPKGRVIDHINGQRLNNRKSNLRPCTEQQNLCNKASRGEFAGIYRHKNGGKYYGRATKNRNTVHVGPFNDPTEAARARDRLALELHGEFAWLNFPDEWPPEKRQAVYAEAKAAKRKSHAGTQRRKGDKQKRKPFTTKFTKTAKKVRRVSCHN